MKHLTRKRSRSEDQATVTVPRATAAWANLLNGIVTKAGPPTGVGWKTVLDVSREIGKNKETARYYIDKWIAEKSVQTAYGTNAKNQRTLFIRPVKKN